MSFELILPFLRPIESLLLDDSVSEIMGNPDGVWWYERRGTLYPAPEVKFETRQLLTGLDVIANKLGRKLGADKPLLNAQLPDGNSGALSKENHPMTVLTQRSELTSADRNWAPAHPRTRESTPTTFQPLPNASAPTSAKPPP